MNILDHLIKDTEITGIGPLMLESANDQAALMLYKTCRYLFELHLKNHTTIIKSEWFDRTGHADEVLSKMRKTMEDFRAQYFKIRKEVAVQIGEIEHVDDPIPKHSRN